ncbi:MAG: hypothetical protein AAGG59_16205 [Bacteroidota bacterium]
MKKALIFLCLFSISLVAISQRDGSFTVSITYNGGIGKLNTGNSMVNSVFDNESLYNHGLESRLIYTINRTWSISTGLEINEYSEKVSVNEQQLFTPINVSPNASNDRRIFLDVENNLVLLGIPLRASYIFLNKDKFRVEFTGGFSAQFLIKSTSTSEDGSKENNEFDNKNLNLSWTVGLIASYRLTKIMSLQFGPNFSQFVSEIDESESLEYKPYKAAVQAGLALHL